MEGEGIPRSYKMILVHLSALDENSEKTRLYNENRPEKPKTQEKIQELRLATD